MKTLARLASLGLLSLFCLAASNGCVLGNSSGDSDDDDGQLAEDAAALTAGSTQSTGLGQVLLSPIQTDDAKAAEAAALAVETKPITGLSPEGCATKTRTGDKVHIEFNSCTGPFGLVRIKGGIDVTISVAANGLHAELKSSAGLTLQDRPVDYSATVDVTVDGTERRLTWSGSWASETLTGLPFEHSSEGDLSVDLATACVTFSGEASGSVGTRGLNLTIDDLAVCPTKCPASGTITASGKESGISVSVEFDGSSSAAVTGPNGRTFKVPLACSKG
jgi:hypothetical protein